MSRIKFTWKLGVAVIAGLACIGYVINFVASQGYNRPALFFAWLGFLIAVIFYQQHRRSIHKVIELDEKEKEEKEFREWAATQVKPETAEKQTAAKETLTTETAEQGAA